MITLLWATSAFALDPSCASPYGMSTWESDMSRVDGLLAASEMERAGAGLAAVQRGLQCLDVPADPDHIARFDRLRAAWFFFDQDEEAALEWGTAAKLAAPELAWDLPEDHPFRVLIDSAEAPVTVAANGAWAVDRRAAVWVDGRPSAVPAVVSELPHFVQIVDDHGEVVRGAWQDGAAFAEGLVGPAAPLEDHHDRPPLLASAGAGALGLAAVGLYGLASVAAGSLDDAPDASSMLRARSAANGLVIGAGVAGAAALGLGIGALIVHDGGGLRVTGQF